MAKAPWFGLLENVIGHRPPLRTNWHHTAAFLFIPRQVE